MERGTIVKIADAFVGGSIAGSVATASMKVHYGRMLVLFDKNVKVIKDTNEGICQIELTFEQEISEDSGPGNAARYQVVVDGKTSTISNVDVPAGDGGKKVILTVGSEEEISNATLVNEGKVEVTPSTALVSKFGLSYSDDADFGGGTKKAMSWEEK